MNRAVPEPRIALVTRPHAQAQEWVARLQQLNIAAAALPLLALRAAVDGQPVRLAWQALLSAQPPALVMFVSPGAVQHFFSPPAGTQMARWPSGVQAGATGPGTAAALSAAGVPLSAIVQPATLPFDSEALWAGIAHQPWAGRQVLLVRGEEGRDWLTQRLQAAGARVQPVAAYRRELPQWTVEQKALAAQALAWPQAHCWLFSSSQAVRHLRCLCPVADWSTSQALASHPRIALSARDAGFGRVDEAAPTPEAVRDALTRSIQSGAP